MATTVFVTLNPITCAQCGCVFGIPAELDRSWRASGGSFYCPNGHSLTFGESEADRLRRELADKQRQIEAQQRATTAARCETLAATAARDIAERKCKRITRRIHAGVCPCCNRTFSNLARHMETKHPDNVPSVSLAK